MDNVAKDFARKIVSELEGIKNLIADAISIPRGKQPSSEDDKPQSDNSKNRANEHATLASGASSAPSTHPAVAENQTPPEKSNQRFEWLKDHIVEMVGVIVVAVYTTFSACTLAAIQESNTINRESVRSVQRAFATPQTFAAIAITDASKKIITDWQFYVPWENSGATPTRHAVTHVSFNSYAQALPDDFPFPDLGQGANTPAVLGPKSTLTSGAMQVSVTTLKSISPAGPHLYFWGWLAYDDIFPRTPRHVTEVCRELTQIIGDVSNPNQQIQWVFTLCNHHNCVDDECADYQAAILR